MGTTAGGTTDGASGTNGSGASAPTGSPQDALGPILAALEQPLKLTTTAGDPKVVAAVRLGWVMREVTEGWALAPAPEGLTPAVCARAQGQLLKTLVAMLALDGVKPDAVVEALGKNDQARSEGAALQEDILVALVSADVRLPRAYAVGGGLRAMIADGSSPSCSHDTAAELIDDLDPLSSSLPAHSVRSVANSLTAWVASSDQDKTSLACAQVLLWRAVLIGEKQAIDLLEADDYIQAGRKLARRYLRTAVRSPWLLTVAALALVLFTAGIVLLLTNTHAGDVAAGLSAVLAGAGLTWKGIGGPVGTLLEHLEEPVWGAELDIAITTAITLPMPPGSAPATDVAYSDRRGRALARATRASTRASIPASDAAASSESP